MLIIAAAIVRRFRCFREHREGLRDDASIIIFERVFERFVPSLGVMRNRRGDNHPCSRHWRRLLHAILHHRVGAAIENVQAEMLHHGCQAF